MDFMVMDNRKVAETLRREILEDYSIRLDRENNLTKKEKSEQLQAVSKFLVHLVTEEGVEETLEILE